MDLILDRVSSVQDDTKNQSRHAHFAPTAHQAELGEGEESQKSTVPNERMFLPTSSPSVYLTTSTSRATLMKSRSSSWSSSLSSIHEETPEEIIARASKAVFEVWDTGKTDVITLDEMLESGLDQLYAEGMARILSRGNTNPINLKSVIDTIHVLEYGDLHEKVELLVFFVDRDGNGVLTKAELESFMPGCKNKDSPFQDLIYKTLRIEDASTMKTHADLFAIFEESSRGEMAIQIFSKQIMEILFSRNKTMNKLVSSHQDDFRLLGTQISINPHHYHRGHGQKKSKERSDTMVFLHTLKLKYGTKENAFVLVLVCLQIFLFIFNFIRYYSWWDYPAVFAVAKGFGLNLRILTCLLFLTMARSTMGIMYSISWLQMVVPMGFNISIHSFIGFSTLLHAIGHATAHIIYKQYYTTGFVSSYKWTSVLRGKPLVVGAERSYDGDTITGTILTVMIFIMAFAAMNRGNGSTGYWVFYHTHFLYLAWIVFILLHQPVFGWLFIAIGILFTVERATDFFFFTVHYNLSHSRPCHNGVTFLNVPRKGPAPFSGCYYRIKIPSLSPTEWHPFSLAGNASSNNLTFFIASLGDWTSKLHEIVSDPVLRSQCSVQVQGPFSAPAKKCLEKDLISRRVCIASGVGITPFLSVMATRVQDEMIYEADEQTFGAMFSEEVEHRYESLNFFEHVQKLAAGVVQKTDHMYTWIPSVIMSLSSRKTMQSTQSSEKNNITVIDDAVLSDDDNVEAPRRESMLHPDDKAEVAEAMFVHKQDIQPLHVVWSIRDVSELTFYMEYIESVVKSQKHLKKQVVHVHVYLTGLGNVKDPKFMMSQCLFLLALAENSDKYLSMYFGRPNLDKIITGIRPDHVYYCGGKMLKETLHEICAEEHIPFHPEDFDSGAHTLPNFVKNVKGTWSSMFPGKQDTVKKGR